MKLQDKFINTLGIVKLSVFTSTHIHTYIHTFIHSFPNS